MGKNKNKKIAHLDKFKELVVYEKTLDFSNSGWKSKIDVYYTFNNDVKCGQTFIQSFKEQSNAVKEILDECLIQIVRACVSIQSFLRGQVPLDEDTLLVVV